MAKERIRVICTVCAWAGRRTAAGGPCPDCEAPTEKAAQRGSNATRGRRVRVVVHVLPSTADALVEAQAASGAVGVGTVAAKVLDEHYAHTVKRRARR